MIQRRNFAAGVVFLVLSVFWPGTLFSQAVLRENPTAHPIFRQAKLVSPQTGWTVVDQPSDQLSKSPGDAVSQHLYWTEDDGQTWREITPSPMLTKNLGYIFFLDRWHGWILATDALAEEQAARFYLYSTEDGGKNWKALLLQRRMFELRDDYTFPSQVFFTDPQHGWILWHWHMMNSSLDSLLGTSDGGRTWKRLPDPPGGGPFQFSSPRDGWMIGGPEVPDGIPVAEAENVWVTHDGGAHWHVLPVSLPEADASETYFVDLRFKNSREGTVIAEQQLSGRLFLFMSCNTADAGKSWHVSRFEAYHATASFAGSHVIWSVSDWPATKVSLRSGDHVIEPTLPAGSSAKPILGDVSFVNESNGWASYFDGRPELVSTTDGGKTFRIITPPIAADLPIPAPELTGLNGILVKFPKSPLGFAPRPQVARQGPPLGSPAGGPMKLRGNGFLLENMVWIGTRSVHANSEDGETLLFLVPQDLPSGKYEVTVENTHGKSNAIEAMISPPQALRISRLQNRDPRFAGEPAIHRGQQVAIGGTGFLIENTVWFGTQPVKGQLIVSMGAGLNLEVPSTLAPGIYEVYVTNANGKSNVVSTVVE